MTIIKYYMKGIKQDDTTKILKGAIEVEDKLNHNLENVFKMLIEKIWNDRANRGPEDYDTIDKYDKEVIIAINDKMVSHIVNGDIIYAIDHTWDALDDSKDVEESMRFKILSRRYDSIYMLEHGGDYLYHILGTTPEVNNG